MITVRELINWLSEYPPDTPVRITWEGILRDVDNSTIYMSHDGVLLIDADGNLYKEDFQSGAMNAND